jgi:malate dehydrogenase (oxaloacetate-decarboxylating)(NADP+)
MTSRNRDNRSPLSANASKSSHTPAARRDADHPQQTLKAEGAQFTRQDALQYHRVGRPGKLEIIPTKPMATQRDLSLAYSPGVAIPVEAIAENPDLAYEYTSKGNIVAVISNGTAILGMGNLGALAAKPVMEGKAVLFKRFADVDSIDIEVDTTDVNEFINAVRYLGPSFGGINLEDIRAPDCFIIEQRLRELMDIPVFHDDQHGTAVIAAAGLINALNLTGREMSEIKLVCNGAGSAGIACIELIKAMGVRHENVLLCDTSGVIYKGREKGMNQWKSAHAAHTSARTLEDAVKGADVFLGLSAAGALTPAMVASMAPRPIIFAMANPDPEITPEEVAKVRSDAIVATGRSDYPNQINNVLGFPYIFRGALDVRARAINEPMKIAAAQAIAELAREDVPDKVAAAYQGRKLHYGPEYIIPAPFDPRLITRIPAAVAKAAMDSGVARSPIVDMSAYHAKLSARLDPAAGFLHAIFEQVRANPKRVVFAEGEQEQVIRAANAFIDSGLGQPVLIGREDQIDKAFDAAGLNHRERFEMHNAQTSSRLNEYADFLYSRLQRKGYLHRDCHRLVFSDRNVFGACMVALGHADAMVTGLTRNWSTAFNVVRQALDPSPGHKVIGISLIISRGRTVLIADTSVHQSPNAVELADIAVEAAGVAQRLGFDPKVALLAYSNFGQPMSERAETVHEAVKILDGRGVDFQYDGEMTASVALNKKSREQYPFCRLKGAANVLIMPAYHAASIATEMLQELGGGTVIGPLLVGLSKPVQIVSLNATDNDIVNMAALAAYDLSR